MWTDDERSLLIQFCRMKIFLATVFLFATTAAADDPPGDVLQSCYAEILEASPKSYNTNVQPFRVVDNRTGNARRPTFPISVSSAALQREDESIWFRASNVSSRTEMVLSLMDAQFEHLVTTVGRANGSVVGNVPRSNFTNNCDGVDKDIKVLVERDAADKEDSTLIVTSIEYCSSNLSFRQLVFDALIGQMASLSRMPFSTRELLPSTDPRMALTDDDEGMTRFHEELAELLNRRLLVAAGEAAAKNGYMDTASSLMDLRITANDILKARRRLDLGLLSRLNTMWASSWSKQCRMDYLCSDRRIHCLGEHGGVDSPGFLCCCLCVVYCS